MIISAPKLKYISLKFNDYDGINVHLFAPLLVKMVLSVEVYPISYYNVEKHATCYYTKFLGGLANLETLIGEGFFTKYLAHGMEHYKHPLVFHHLKTIALGEVSFDESMDEILAVIRLIVDASATLCDLQLSIYDSVEDDEPTGVHLWDITCPQNCTFLKLKFVKVENFIGEIQELNFIKFLLESSPVLEKMTIKPAANKPTKECIIKMLSYRRASTNATIVFEHI